MPPKRNHPSPAAVSPSTNANSMKPSTAVSSKPPNVSSSSVKPSSSSSSAAPTTGKSPITFSHSSNTPYTPPSKPSSSTKAPTINSTNTSTSAPSTTASITSSKALLNLKQASKQATNFPQILSSVWNKYLQTTPQRVKLIDAFMAFLVTVGGLQFLYCLLVGNYPFNAFLSGFSATVGQFVLTASLRIQTNPENRVEFRSVSDERAFADYVFGSLILHVFCVNFIN